LNEKREDTDLQKVHGCYGVAAKSPSSEKSDRKAKKIPKVEQNKIMNILAGLKQIQQSSHRSGSGENSESQIKQKNTLNLSGSINKH